MAIRPGLLWRRAIHRLMATTRDEAPQRSVERPLPLTSRRQQQESRRERGQEARNSIFSFDLSATAGLTECEVRVPIDVEGRIATAQLPGRPRSGARLRCGLSKMAISPGLLLSWPLVAVPRRGGVAVAECGAELTRRLRGGRGANRYHTRRGGPSAQSSDSRPAHPPRQQQESRR